MTTRSAVAANFCDLRLVKGRAVVQLVLEAPIENADEVLKSLGGIPQPGQDRWVGIALLPDNRAAKGEVTAPAETPRETGKVRRSFDKIEPSAQAAIRCDDPEFREWLKVTYGDNYEIANGDAASVLRNELGIKSRAELNTDRDAAFRWRAVEREFQAWRTTQRYAESVRR